MKKEKCEKFIEQIKAGCTVNMSYELLSDFMISCGQHKLNCKIKIDGDKIGAILTMGS